MSTEDGVNYEPVGVENMGRYEIKLYPVALVCSNGCFHILFHIIDSIDSIISQTQELLCPICGWDALEIQIRKGQDTEDDPRAFSEVWENYCQYQKSHGELVPQATYSSGDSPENE